MNPQADQTNVAILISGRGSNMQALLQATQAPDYPARVGLVLSDNCHAEGLQHAKAAGIKTSVVEYADYQEKATFEAAINTELTGHGIEFICLAGFMRILSAAFVERWNGRLINIHPSLLPLFPGLNTHGRALEDRAEYHGCTVHYVTSDVDGGPIIAQSKLLIETNHTEHSLAEDVLELEHQLYPEALKTALSNLPQSA